MDNPNCLRCGHPFNSHGHAGDDKCRRKKLVGWNEAAKAFTAEQACSCTSYMGRVPRNDPGKHGCPHELIEGSRVCVACKEPVPVQARR
jgi:hypothetical protein